MEIQNLLGLNYERLLVAYRENIDHVQALQATLTGDILPSVVDEFELDPEAIEWAKNWLNDIASIFRIARRNKFTRSFALESIRKNLIWRLQNLWPVNTTFVSPPALHCLPERVRDPFGRPVLVVEFVPVDESPEVIKTYIVQVFERLRLHLKSLSFALGEPVLQYTVLLDLAKLSLQAIDIDILTWTIREVIPRFPGMLAGVINYSWAHSGLWSVVRRVLPRPALSRVFFPTREDLLIAMTPAALPKDYGGILPFLRDLDDPLRPGKTQVRTFTEGVIESINTPSSSTSQSTPGYVPPISPTSPSNPFYGYPTASTHGYPQPKHGRRRKRDLARTLARLFWLRWRTHITIGVVLAVLSLALNFGFRRRFIRAPGYFLSWRTSQTRPPRPP